jgi:serine/threonine-protein kinase PRP4
VTLLNLDKPTTDLQAMLLRNQTVEPGEARHLANFRDLLEKMLAVDPERRITIKDALKHPFMVEHLE